VTDWLEAIIARGLPVSGVYLLPLVTASLPEKLGAAAPSLLVVAQHSGGLRLTFFRDRQFRLSRLTRGESGRADNRARYFAEEISNTRLYLHALRTLTLDEHLSVLLLDRSDELGEVAQAIARENPSLDCVRVGRRELATKLGITEPLLDVSPYVVYLQLLGLKVPESNLAPDTVTVGYRRYRARNTIYAASGALALAGAIWAGSNLYQMFVLQGEKENTARQTAMLTRQYQDVTRQFPAAPASADNLKKTVELAQDLRKTARTPEAVMAMVSRALEVTPNVVIRERAWKYGATEISSERTGPSATAAGGAAPAATPSPATPVPGTGRKQSALIDGEIRPFNGDFRAAITTINDLAARLGKDPRVAEVRIVKLPLNVNPSQPLAGNTLDSPEQNATADYKLVMVLKPEV